MVFFNKIIHPLFFIHYQLLIFNKMKFNYNISILILSICLMLTSCVNYYYQTAKFNLAVQTGNFNSAEAAIKSKGR